MSQSWPEFLSGLLQTSTRVDKAAVFNATTGQLMAATDGLQISDKDGRAILQCLRDPAHTLTRITVDDTDFRCFQGSGQALVGMATLGGGTGVGGSGGRVLVARVTEEGVVVVVMGTATAKGSFLFEVQQCLTDRTRRQMAPSAAGGAAAAVAEGGALQQKQQRQQLPQAHPRRLNPPPSSPPPVNQEQVLVQIHD